MTSFAAPPVLMVAGKWGWDTAFMFTTFGWKAAIGVLVNALAVTFLFRHELSGLKNEARATCAKVPLPVVFVHIVFLAGVVVFAHHPVVFMGLLLFFLGFASAYERYQDRLILREGLLVAFFLPGWLSLGDNRSGGCSPCCPTWTTLYFFWRHPPYRNHRQCSAHLSGFSPGRHERRVPIFARCRRRYRRRAYSHCQCTEPGRLFHIKRFIQRWSNTSFRLAGSRASAHDRCHSCVSPALNWVIDTTVGPAAYKLVPIR